jgi:hypothetical protein
MERRFGAMLMKQSWLEDVENRPEVRLIEL